jgi:DNA-binding NarL/FixJ family response regulator
MQRRTVLLITSPEMGWAELHAALRTLEDVQVVGEVTTAHQAIELASRLRPDVILSAARVDGVSARPLLLDLQRRGEPASKIIVFAGRLDPDLFAAVDNLRLSGYLLWSDLSAEALPHVLAAVMAGDVVVGTPTVARAFIDTLCRPTRARPGAPRLSVHEQAVLRRLAEGLTYDEIATAEQLSERTVARIVADLREKLEAPTNFMLGMKAVELGFTP